MHERLNASLPASSTTTSQAAINTQAANQCAPASSALSASSDVVDSTVAPASTSTCAEKNDDSSDSRRFTRDAVELLRRQLDGHSGNDLLRLRLDPNTSESEKKTVECLLYVPAIQKCM